MQRLATITNDRKYKARESTNTIAKQWRPMLGETVELRSSSNVNKLESSTTIKQLLLDQLIQQFITMTSLRVHIFPQTDSLANQPTNVDLETVAIKSSTQAENYIAQL